MPKKTHKAKTFHVMYKLTLELAVDIEAPTLALAVEHATKANVSDLLDLSDFDVNDSAIAPSGVFEND